jgi:prepilin-type N-terminal cleavage/methylation domain-containing protein
MNMMNSAIGHSRRSEQGFSLVEISIVIAIISILTTVTMYTFSRSGANASQLETGTVQLSNLLNLARTEAITRNVGVQFRLIIDGEDIDEQVIGRTYSLWTCPKNGGDYAQLTKWQQLPANIFIQEDDSWFDSTKESNTDLSGNNPFDARIRKIFNDVQFQGHRVTALVFEFSPTGGIRQPQPDSAYSTILLAANQPGNTDATNINNWRQIRVSNLTGHAIINAPQ